MPSVRLLNSEWQETCEMLKFAKTKFKVEEKRLVQRVLSIHNPHNETVESFEPWKLTALIRELEIEYSNKVRDRTASSKELQTIWETKAKLEELAKNYRALSWRAHRFGLIYKKFEEASKKKNGILDQSVEHDYSGSSDTEEKESVILSNEWGW